MTGGTLEIQAAVLDWYTAHRRDLAFRRTADPWAVLVSEVIAQQTQAARAAAAWTRFIAQFPSPASLAAASPATAIRAWRGLGYNRRALALRRAALAIVEQHGSRVPDSLDALLALPGIGPYTARAVLAIAFNQPVAALDVNVRRVLGRLFGDSDLRLQELQVAADAFVPAGRAASWTHALMDIGAVYCRPRDPRCEACPLAAWCADKASRDRPVSRERTASRAARDWRSLGARRAPSPRFETTSRWLRGRILDRLRDAPDGAWLTFDAGIGSHDAAAVQAAVAALAMEGMIEASGAGARLASEP
jgi:A/G-specific adenine glycosylase